MRSSSLLAAALFCPVIGISDDRNGVDFDRDIRPLLAENCFDCHGPDAKKRKAKLRLDTKEGALTPLDGTSPIFPGKRYEDWVVADPAGQDLERVREIRDDIRDRTVELLSSVGIEANNSMG